MRNGRKRLTKICGAMNRQGKPCQCKLLYGGDKCKFHGGLSTGARTPEGRLKALSNLKQYRDGTRPIPPAPAMPFKVMLVQGKVILIPR